MMSTPPLPPLQDSILRNVSRVLREWSCSSSLHQVTSNDKTPTVVSSALEKHSQDTREASRYELIQLLPEGKGRPWVPVGGLSFTAHLDMDIKILGLASTSSMIMLMCNIISAIKKAKAFFTILTLLKNIQLYFKKIQIVNPMYV